MNNVLSPGREDSLKADLKTYSGYCTNILKKAESEKRQLNEYEKASFEAYMKNAEKIRQELSGEIQPPPRGDSLGGDYHETTAARFIDNNGNSIQVLSSREKFADVPAPNGKRHESLSLGKLIVGAVSGNWKNAAAEKLSMAEGRNEVGGFLFGDSFSRQIIDYARAKSAVIRAGAGTVGWTGSDTLVMARVAADPTFQVAAENAELTERELTFRQISFTAHKIGCLISMSRELASDAPNAAAIVDQILAKALACELDRIALVGTQPNGLLNYSDIESTDSIGAIAWPDVHAAKIEVENNNFEPSAYICSPTIGGDLDLIQASTAGTWLGAPPSLTNVPRYITNNCPDANLFMGQWDQFVFAIRQDGMVEVTTSGGDAFKKHQLLVKITWRGDVGCFDESAFHVLKGITT